MNGVSSFKVVVTARSFGEGSDEPFAILRGAGCEVVKSPSDRPLGSEELAELIGEADALVVGNDRVDAQAIGAAPRLKVISRYGVGVDNVDLAAASARGIVVTNTPGANDNSVADLAMALILACARQLPEAVRIVKGGQWKRAMGGEVWQKTLGVIGTGRIGKGVARRARGFDMSVLCYDVVRDDRWAEANQATYAGLEEVLSRADFVTLHVPLLPSTNGLISSHELALMKRSAYLINTSRGGIVDEEALYRALASGQLAGAALDVLEKEPGTDSPLCRLDNVLITAHIGGYTRDAVRNMGVLAARNVIDVLTGQGSRFVVNGRGPLRGTGGQEGAGMSQLRGIAHIAIDVREWEETRRFYEELLGLSLDQPVRLSDGTCLTYASLADGTRLEFFMGQGTAPADVAGEREAGLRHLAFKVAGLEEFRNRLVAAGTSITLDLTPLPELGLRVLLFKDPNGVTLEFAEPLEPDREASPARGGEMESDDPSRAPRVPVIIVSRRECLGEW